MWLHSSVGRASHRYRGGHGYESRWSLDFFRFLLSNCLNWKIYCNDHSSLWHSLQSSFISIIRTELTIHHRTRKQCQPSAKFENANRCLMSRIKRQFLFSTLALRKTVNAQLSKVITGGTISARVFWWRMHLFSATYFTFASPEDITIRALHTANTTAGTKLFF